MSTLKQVRPSVLEFLESRGRKLENFKIRVIDHPTVEEYFIESFEPEYVPELGDYFILGINEWETEWFRPDEIEALD